LTSISSIRTGDNPAPFVSDSHDSQSTLYLRMVFYARRKN
jgi:hypothetical protein